MTAEDILFHFIFHYFICCFDALMVKP